MDEVNTKKLFETGVSAMLRSLDPYTEYYETGGDVMETVSGKYGGIGLVISGETRQALDDKENKLANPITPGKEDDDSSDDVVMISGEDREPMLDRMSWKGIKVVNAFEGYAYDSGMRVGDRLEAVDSRSVKGMSVEEVRNILRGEPGVYKT